VRTIRLATTDEEIEQCFPVLRQLRPHLEESSFVARARLQAAEGFQLAYLAEGGTVRAVAGFRILENLVSGRVLYVDDLVSDAAQRSMGHGGELFSWLEEFARGAGCQTLELDSGVQRFDAHRFYLLHRMVISAHHFRLVLETDSAAAGPTPPRSEGFGAGK
jgi:GNAT superfamily N-acetyltransferase